MKTNIYLSLILTVALLVCTGSSAAAFDKIKINTILDKGEYKDFIKELGTAITFNQITPAKSLGILGFNVLLNGKLINVSEDETFWQKATGSNSLDKPSSVLFAPQLFIAKGLPLGIDVEGMYMPVSGADISAAGLAVKVPLMKGGVAKPAISTRFAYSALVQDTNFKMDDYNLNISISKGFAILTPFAFIGFHKTRLDPDSSLLTMEAEDESNVNVGAGLKISLGFFKISISGHFGKKPALNIAAGIGL